MKPDHTEGMEGKPESAERRNGAPAAKPAADRDVCPRCGESSELAQIKGCLRCLTCGFKWDCNGW
jgi:ribosomal protein S27AE